ncbi:hypothetical protein B5X24_HaOG207710 [Helicoverpa armigera]|uniref:Uncharacterized protein n=1 Tax=Helicoverpa armigera TaxID=29058 RepID=A0A2W1BJQ3_HELAM|nr:hypothetical protein B5X24_HaOG207710 [Helicoverpa armigera]
MRQDHLIMDFGVILFSIISTISVAICAVVHLSSVSASARERLTIYQRDSAQSIQRNLFLRECELHGVSRVTK